MWGTLYSRNRRIRIRRPGSIDRAHSQRRRKVPACTHPNHKFVHWGIRFSTRVRFMPYRWSCQRHTHRRHQHTFHTVHNLRKRKKQCIARHDRSIGCYHLHIPPGPNSQCPRRKEGTMRSGQLGSTPRKHHCATVVQSYGSHSPSQHRNPMPHSG